MKNFLPHIRSLFSSSPAFQILSDLHLELGLQYSSFEVPPSAPDLILAGDIGRLADYDAYVDFLGRQVRSFEHVFLVLGNHEFYGLSYEEGLARAQNLLAEPTLHGRLILLHRARYDLPDSNVTLLGCTLWSRIPEAAAPVISAKVKDFQRILDWTVSTHNTVFEEELNWLQNQASSIYLEATPRKIVVVTHHGPCVPECSRPEHASNPWSAAFATDLLTADGRQKWTAGIKVWVYGHTHFTTAFQKGGVRVVSNQRGYVLPGGAIDRREDKFDVRWKIRV